jgi:hypothetical protein
MMAVGFLAHAWLTIAAYSEAQESFSGNSLNLGVIRPRFGVICHDLDSEQPLTAGLEIVLDEGSVPKVQAQQ